MKREKHLGFIEPKVDKRDYYLGGGNLPRVILEPLGDWSDALPVNELQNIRNIETYNCTAFGATNQIEMYEYKAFGERNNYSDRFVGICAGTKAPGNDPTTVYEAIRKYGLIPEEMLPFSDDIKTIDDYFSFKGADMEACYRKGREWLATHEFLHQWVFDRNAPLEEKMNNMKIALKYSPLAIGVWAWTLNDQGCYVREGIDVHWTVCHCATNLEYIFDSYSPFLKLLVPDFNFYYAKRISIEKKDPIAENQKAYAFLSELLDLAKTICLKMLQQLKLMPKTPEITPITPIEKPKNAIRRTLSEIAIEYIGKDASPANLAPSEVSCAEAVSNIINQYDSSFPKGITYTPDLVKELDKSKLFERTLTPSKDCVIISPTERTNIGHAGIFITDSRIVSNDSKSGLMADNYSYNNWIKYFKTGKGLRILIFKLI